MKKTGKKKALTAIQEGDEELATASSVQNALTQAATAAKKVQSQLKEAKKTSKRAEATAAKEQKAIEDLAKKEADRIAKEDKARRLVELERQAAENLRGATGKNAKKSNTRKLAALRNSGLDYSVQEYLKMKAAIRTLKNRGFRNGSGVVEGPGGKKFICENCKPVTEAVANTKTTAVAPATETSAEIKAASAQTNPLSNIRTNIAETTSDEIIENLDE